LGQLGKMLLAQQFDHEADICFAEAGRLDPADPRWLYGRCVRILKRDPDHAVAMLEEAKALADAAPKYPRYRSVIYMQLAEALLEGGQLDAAEAICRAEQQHNPNNPRPVLRLGLIAQARGDTALAEQLLTTAQASLSCRRFATAQLAALARSRGDRTAADIYEKQVAASPPEAVWPDPFFEEIASLQVGQRGFERQVKRLESERQYDEAVQLYRKRIEKHPTVHNYVGAGVNLARLAQQQTDQAARAADYDQAFRMLRQAVELGPDNSFAHYTLAQVVFARAERDQQADPDSPQIKAWFREVRDHAKRAVELRPGYAEAYLWWGLALKHLGEPKEALAPLRAGVTCQPSDFRLQLSLGQALIEADRGAEAETYLENARKLGPDDPRPVEALKRLRKK
jgi:tetratricopeptide (TPR) repeat protein